MAASGPNLSTTWPCFGQTSLAVCRRGQRINRSTYASSDADDIGVRDPANAIHATAQFHAAAERGRSARRVCDRVRSWLRAPTTARRRSRTTLANIPRGLWPPPRHRRSRLRPRFHPDMGASAPPVVPTLRASDIRDIKVENNNNRPDEIRVDNFIPSGERPASKWGKRVVIGALGLCSAIAAAAWQHYGDQAKAMAVSWAPQSVVAALLPSETPAAAEAAGTPAIQAASPDQAATTEQPVAPAKPEQAAATVATTPSTESAQLQSMAQDLAAMTRQVEELKANIAQLRTSHAQMAREVAKAADARAPDARLPEQTSRPRVAAVPPPRTVPPSTPRRPPPAQAAYIPPVQPLPPPAAAPVQAQPAPPPQLADDGQPVVRPPMPLR